jgi:hypothetical protein
MATILTASNISGQGPQLRLTSVRNVRASMLGVLILASLIDNGNIWNRQQATFGCHVVGSAYRLKKIG